jgi:hypothetical protein
MYGHFYGYSVHCGERQGRKDIYGVSKQVLMYFSFSILSTIFTYIYYNTHNAK